MFDIVHLFNSKVIATYYHTVKNGQKRSPFTVSHYRLERKSSLFPENEVPTQIWHYLRFTTITGSPSGDSFPEFASVKSPDLILWYGNIASFHEEQQEKHVLMVVYFDAEKKCIWHSCYLIQYDPETYLTPSLYCRKRGKDRQKYKSFKHIRPEDRNAVFFSQNISANVFEVDRHYCSTPSLERSGRLSNDNGKTWTRFRLTFSLETMSPTLTLVKLP